MFRGKLFLEVGIMSYWEKSGKHVSIVSDIPTENKYNFVSSNDPIFILS